MPSIPTHRRTTDLIHCPAVCRRWTQHAAPSNERSVQPAPNLRRLPFELGRQSCASPTREGIGFVVADMLTGASGSTGCAPAQSRIDRTSRRLVSAQYKRRAPFLPTHPSPIHPTATAGDFDSLRRRRIRQPFAIGDKAICERVRLEPDCVARPLTVESETRAS